MYKFLIALVLVGLGSSLPSINTDHGHVESHIPIKWNRNPNYKEDPSLLIVGGFDTTIENYPWTVILKYRQGNIFNFICGGSIIHKKYVLTAAHCCEKSSTASNYQIQAGVTQRSNTSGQTIEVTNVIIHNMYHKIELNYDSCLLELKEDVIISDQASVIKLPGKEDTIENLQNCFVSGWGTTSSGSTSNILQCVEVPLIWWEECNTMYNNMGWEVYDDMTCAGDIVVGGKDACQGDSGGPLVCKNKGGDNILIGIVSWGYGCGIKDYPGVYANVTMMMPFISNNTNNAMFQELSLNLN